MHIRIRAKKYFLAMKKRVIGPWILISTLVFHMGLVRWQMVLSCGSGSSDRGPGGVLSVSVWLPRAVVWAAWSWGIEFGGFWRWVMAFGFKNPFSVSVLYIVPVCWLWSWDVGPERRGYVSVGISCSVHCCGFVVTVVLHHIVG